MAGALACLMFAPPLQWWQTNKDAIQTIAFVAGAIGASGTLVFTGWRSWAQFKQMQTDRLRHVTASFEGAVTLLGHEDRSVRLGAIYALERIARQNRDEHWPVMETLTAYVREWSRRRRWAAELPGSCDESDAEELEEASEPAFADIQAIFTVLGRRRIEHERKMGSAPRRLNLAGAYLVDAEPDPSPAREFGRARLDYADLSDAGLQGASLTEASFLGANLQGIFLIKADLRRAKLFQANLFGARLEEADLRGAILGRAKLTGANLDKACLRGANLLEANLKGVDLSTARGLTQDQLNSAIGDKDTKIPGGLITPDHWSE